MNDSRALLKSYLYLLGGTALISVTAFTLVITKIDPMRGALLEASAFALILFYISLFFALTSVFSLIIIGLRSWIYSFTSLYKNLSSCIRQGFFLSLIGVSSLLLQSIQGLNWITAMLLIVSMVLIEFYFQNTEQRR